MPTVPNYDNLRTAVSGAPNVPATLGSGPNAEEVAGQQLERAGTAVQRAGDVGSRIALAAQDQVNQTRVNDAVNKARVAAQDLAYNPQTGYLALKGENAVTVDGQALPDAYGAKFKEHLGTIAGTLGNPEQQRAFQMAANDLSAQFHGQAEQHMMGEFLTYRNKVFDASMDLASNDVKLNWADGNRIFGSVDDKGNRTLGAIDAIKAAAYGKAQALGLQGAPADAMMLAAVSHAHTGAIQAALENNRPDLAYGYLERARKAGEMTGDDVLKVQSHVNKHLTDMVSAQAVQGATAAAMPRMIPTTFDRVLQITLTAESGGQRYGADGKLLTSSAGAKGEMQVLDGTNKAPGLGVTPARDDSPDERARVGRDYMQALIQKYGDPAKAWAAYHAGFGTVDKAIAEADKDAGSFRTGAPADLWLQKLGPKTQAYVVGNMKALQGSGGVLPRPTELEFVNDVVARLPAGAPPPVVQAARAHATQQFSVMTRSLAQQGDNAVGVAQRWLAQNNGNYAAMPAELRDAVDRFAPGKSDDLLKYAKVFERGTAVTDPVLYNRLTAHQDELARMTDAQFESLRPALALPAFEHFSRLRADIMSGKVAPETAGSINVAAMKAALNPRLAGLGINTAPSPKDTAAQERVAGVREFVRQSLFEGQRATGRKFTPEEVEDHIDRLFLKSVEFKGVLWGTNTENLMGMQFKDVPSAAVDGLRTALMQNGNRAPTNNDILNLYRKLHAK